MKSLQIVESVADEASGPSYSVARLSQSLGSAGLNSRVLCLDLPKVERQADGVFYRGYDRDFQNWPSLSKLGFSRAFRAGLAEEWSQGTILHVHGLWRMINVYPSRLARVYGAPLLLSPRGMLGGAALEFSRRQKRIFWSLLQKRALEAVTCYHATSLLEADDIRAFGLSGPISVIPNGVDVPDSFVQVAAPKGQRTILFLSRVHPKKGLDQLLLAWAALEAQFPDWRLRIVGPSELDHVNEMKALSRRLGTERVVFEDPVYGATKSEAYYAADIFVLPTRHENFGMVVAEALAHGTPVICTKGAPWQGLQTEECGWWIDYGVEPLATALRDAMGTPPKLLSEMGRRGRNWMMREFSWDSVAQQMAKTYSWCLGRGDRPESVVI